MKSNEDRRWTALLVLIVSALFFVMGFLFPMLQTGYGIGPITLRTEYIYLHSSFRYFFDKGEIFIGFLLLFFTIIFPITKYIFLFLTLAGRVQFRRPVLLTVLEIVNKWAMLDVFVVAVLILNMKFDSTIIISRLENGTTLFAISILLMMTASILARKTSIKNGDPAKKF